MMSSTDGIKNPNPRSIEIPSNIRLIYLDNSEPNSHIRSNLLEINSTAQFYTNIHLCIDFIKSISTEQIFLIISNIFLSDIFDLIYSLQSILAIFIYNKTNDQEITDLKIQYPKIIDRYSNENDLVKSIQEKIQFIEKQILVYNLFDPKEKFTQDLTKESASFLWHQMLINIIKQIPPNEMLNKSSDYYRNQFFGQNYTRQQAIQWYTNDYSLYKLLNHALHTKNIELLYSFRVFIIDLCFEIEREYEKIKNQGNLIVYRAQIMSKEEIEKLKTYIGCLISINGFLSTSRDKNISLEFLQQYFSTNENVLFEIHVDLSIERIILADISLLNIIPGENQILFSMNSLFKIESIEYDLINNLWNIKMIASNVETKCINEYLKWIQNEMDYHSSLVYFGHLLWNQLGEINQAKKFFQILLKSLPNDHKDIPGIDIELGNLNDQIGEYNLALNNYQSALNIQQKQNPKDFIRIASSLNNIGVVYKHMGDIDQAIEFYRQSLEIYETNGSNEENHFHRANTIENLGSAYRDKNDFSQALNYYHQALSIQELIYPNDHLNKANTIRNIGLIYGDQKDWINALNYFNRTLEMRQHLLSNHPEIAICYGDIGNIYEKMNNLNLAFDYYHQQYQIEELCLPINHPNLILHFDWIINILKKTDQPDKAIELCQEQLSNLKDNLKTEYENHPRIARLLVLLATMYEDKNPKEADQHYQHALIILEHNKNEEIFSKCLSTMTNFYWKCRMFDRALICQMKLLNLRRLSLSSNHNDIAYTLRGLARLYRAMNKSSEALEYYEQSLVILQTNYGSKHIDVENIQKEILDLKDIMKSISSSANEDYNYRRISNVHKQLLITSEDDLQARSSRPNYNAKNKPSISVLKSSICIII